MCLARAILKKAKIVVLDEATANVDFETDQLVQKKIKEKFSHCTLFTIAHRLSTIIDYDKILVIDKGQLIEFDRPYKLLVNSLEDTYITKSGIFANFIKDTGEASSNALFLKAKRSFYKNKINH